VGRRWEVVTGETEGNGVGMITARTVGICVLSKKALTGAASKERTNVQWRSFAAI
jgi:hypothetical protein